MRETHPPVRMAPLIANQLITEKIPISNDSSKKYSLVSDFSLFAWFQFESTSEYFRPVEMFYCCLHLQHLHFYYFKTEKFLKLFQKYYYTYFPARSHFDHCRIRFRTHEENLQIHPIIAIRRCQIDTDLVDVSILAEHVEEHITVESSRFQTVHLITK